MSPHRSRWSRWPLRVCQLASLHGEFFDSSVLSIQEDLLAGEFSVFPNPTNEILTIRLNHISPEGVELRVLDAAGRLIQSESMNGKYQTTWDVASWSPGIYLVEMLKSGQRSCVPVMKH